MVWPFREFPFHFLSCWFSCHFSRCSVWRETDSSLSFRWTEKVDRSFRFDSPTKKEWFGYSYYNKKSHIHHNLQSIIVVGWNARWNLVSPSGLELQRALTSKANMQEVVQYAITHVPRKIFLPVCPRMKISRNIMHQFNSSKRVNEETTNDFTE